MTFHALTLTTGHPLLIKAPVFARDSEVRAYHVELISRVMAIDGYYLPEADPLLFGHFEAFYQAIAQRLTPKFDPSLLTPDSRHAFFISTGLEDSEREPGKQAIGLSGLERLMGYQSNRGEVEGKATIQLTSGDQDMDLLASLELIFKGRVAWLVNHYSRPQLLSLLSQAQNIRRGQAAVDELQQEQDRALYEQNAADYSAKFKALGGFAF